jgi:outer membrane protein insertion porin family
VEHRAAVLPDDAGPAVRRTSSQPCFTPEPRLPPHVTGFGIRWFSPLGPLRFEWGFPLAPLPYEKHSDFEFTIGNFF